MSSVGAVDEALQIQPLTGWIKGRSDPLQAGHVSGSLQAPTLYKASKRFFQTTRNMIVTNIDYV